MSPYQIVFGRAPTLPLDHAISQLHDVRVQSVADFLRERDACVRAVRESLSRAAAAMKRQADRRRRDVHYAVGDWVMLSTQNLRLAEGASRKLAPRWTGPFHVLQVVSPVAYRLELP